MKNKKLLLFIIISVSTLLILSGCSNEGVSLSLSPNPVEFNKNQTTRDIELTVKTEGMGNLSFHKMIVEIIDKDGKNITVGEKDLDISSPVVGGLSETINYTLDLEKIFNPAEYGYKTGVSFTKFYNEFLQGKTHTLRITVTGSNNSSLTTQIKYN